MIGQGSPDAGQRQAVRTALAAAIQFAPSAARVWAIVAAIALLIAPAARAQSQALDLRLRIAWGGGPARTWSGRLTTADGKFSALTYLGVEANQAATCYLHTDTQLKNAAVVIAQQSAVQYSGFEVTIRAPAASNLALELAPLDSPQESQVYQVPLASLITGDFQKSIDNDGNRLMIQRTGGDRIRVDVNRNSLVFAPGESFTLQVTPHALGLDAPTELRCVMQLARARGGDVVDEQQRQVTIAGPDDDPATESFTISIPNSEGVYDVIISLYGSRFTDTLMRRRPITWRKVQLVVIGDQRPSAPPATWQIVTAVDPNHASWMEWLSHVPKLPLLPDFRQQPLDNGKAEPWSHLGQGLVRLQPGGWRAYPLAIEQPGLPHILEIDYPSDLEQTLGISIVEPNATGQIVPIELDSGVEVRPRWDIDAPRMLRHRVPFWPRTKTPLVLLTNRHAREPAAFGAIRVLAGPTRLATPTAPAEVDNSADGPAHRMLAVYFDKPLFPEQFCASEGADWSTGQSLDDWTTFYEAATRFVDYLQHTGYNGAIVSVNCQGSTLYPSRVLASNPQYDTGVFFMTGQDPMRKDVLEMLFRLFDRAGLTLVPAVQFSGALPGIERLRRSSPQAAVGIDLVNAQQQSWTAVHGTRRGMAPHYNPLDPRVQRAMGSVLDELTMRYHAHRAFGGLAVQLDPDAYATFPGGFWGQDPATRARFERADNHQSTSTSAAAKTAFRSRDRHGAWLAWRAKELARFYKKMAANVAHEASGARLFLMSGNLFATPVAQRMLRPTLPNHFDLDDVMLQLGLAPRQFADAPDLVFCRSDHISSDGNPTVHGADINLATSADSSRCFADAPNVGALFYHEPLPLPLPSFDRVSPFGAEKTHTVLIAHLTPSSIDNRKRFVLRMAERDYSYLADGGWMLPIGQEAALQPLLRTLQALPALRFETVQPHASGLPTQPLVVRTLKTDGQTYVYIVNPCPWTVTAEFDLQAADQCQLRALGGRTLPAPTALGNQLTWTLDIPPYDIVAAVLTGAVDIPTWRATLDRDAFVRLRREANALRSRANALAHAPDFHALKNPGFESPDDPLADWIHGRGPGITIRADDKNPYAGKYSLQMSSTEAVAWVRSVPFAPPTTGRISVMVRLRTDDPEHQPPVRFVVEGRRTDGSTYFKHADDVGAGKKRLGDQWSMQPFMLHINDLPTSGLVDLRVGFDLLGKGTVWIDDVQVYDLWFLPNERDELTIMSAVATMALNKGRTSDCLQVLDAFWPQFLNAHIETAELRTAALPTDAPPPGPAIPAPQSDSVLDKVRRRLPKRVFPFQLKY